MRHPKQPRSPVPWASCAVALLSASNAGNSDTARPDSAIAIVDVNVVPMDRNAVLPHQTVVIVNGRITFMGPAPHAPAPKGAIVVTGRGRFLMPGLIDMHVHLLRQADLASYLDAGVLTVRNMWGTDGVRRLQADVAAGRLSGPTIVSASPGLDGTPAQWPGTIEVLDSASAGDAVRRQVAAGWRYIKVYTQLTPPAYRGIVVAAHAAHIPFVGHVPLRVDVREALASGQLSIEHLTGYDRAISRSSRSGTWGWSDADTSRFPSLVAATLASRTWNCPTLAIYARLAEQQPADRAAILANRRRFVLALSRAGAGLLLGTDAGIDVVAPGTSLHDELAEFVAAGLTPYTALRAGTIDAANFLGRPDLGRVSVGAAADLLLVAANPLADVSYAGQIEGTVMHGRWLARTTRAQTPAIAGDYDTAVSLGENSCPAVTVQPALTTITQRSRDSLFTLRHGPLTYRGRLARGGKFATDTQTVQIDGGTVAVSAGGTFTSGGFTADALVRVRSGAPCSYRVHWAGTRRQPQ